MPFIDYILPASPDAKSEKHTSPDELMPIIWERWARIHMQNRLRHGAYNPVFGGGYIDSQSKGGLAVKQWQYKDGAFVFRFHDGDGLFRTLARASRHFTEVSFTTMLEEDHFSRTIHFEGWHFEPTRNATAVLNDNATPFIELRKGLYMLSAPEKPSDPPHIETDPRMPALTFEALDETERASVTFAVENHRCACQLCEYYRPRVQKLVEKRQAKADKPPKAKKGGAR